MSRNETRSITVSILGRDYQVACPPEERDALYAAAHYVDDRMRAIRKRSAGLGLEKLTIMTALNMARQLLETERGQTVTPLLEASSEAELPTDNSSGSTSATTTATGSTISEDDSERLSQMSFSIRDTLEDEGPSS